MRNSADTIRHIGTVTRIEGKMVHVRMLQSSACSGCHAAKLCQSSEVKEKEVDVMTSESNRYEVGEKVLLLGSVRQGLNATLWAYVLPLVLLVAVMMCCAKMGCKDTLAGAVGLAVLVPYFFCLYLLRERLRRKFQFDVRKLE